MATLRDILRRITAVKNTSKITQAMKMVAAAQLKRAQRATESARPYVLKLEDMMSNLVAAVGEEYSHPMTLKHKEIRSVAMIIISSDRGMCGSFNANLIRVVNDYIKDQFPIDYPNATLDLIPVGRKAVSFFKKTKHHIAKGFPNVFIKLNFTAAKDIVEVFKSGYIKGDYDKVVIFFNEFINVLKQLPTLKVLLPIESRPGEISKKGKTGFKTDYIFEPDKESILDELLPKLVDIQVWRTMLESNAAEQAARMVAMDNATTNAIELIKALELQYNKARQASITKEMLEIVSGAEALKKG